MTILYIFPCLSNHGLFRSDGEYLHMIFTALDLYFLHYITIIFQFLYNPVTCKQSFRRSVLLFITQCLRT
jgi:hypothetical protein